MAEHQISLGSTLEALLEDKKYSTIKDILITINPADIAAIFEDLQQEQLPLLFRLLPKELAAETFVEMDSDSQKLLIHGFSDSELREVLDELYVDDAVDLVEEMPANVVKRILAQTNPEMRKEINEILRYPENSAGSIMTAEFIDLKKYMSVKESLARIRRIGEDKETIYVCFVISADRKLEGIVTVKDLLLADDDTIIEDLMDRNVIFASTTEDQESVSEKFSDYDLMALPVVDKEGRLVGIVTVDDIIDVMEQETTEDFEIMAAMTPSDKPYSRTGAIDMWKNRVPWLLFLMLSATFTTMILNSFEDALAVQAVLIGFIPIIMGTGGNSGAQSSTAIIRSLSLGDTEPEDALKVIWKEWRVALLCGLTLAAVNFVKMLLVDNLLLGNPDVDYTIALIVSLAIVFTVMFAKVVGSFLPMLAEKIGLDPAVVATPLITTISDAVSLLIYLEIAKVFLHI